MKMIAKTASSRVASHRVRDHRWNLQRRLAEPSGGRVADAVLYLDFVSRDLRVKVDGSLLRPAEHFYM